MKKINWNIVNAAFWTEVTLSYILPFRVVDDFSYQVGFPIPFITVYDGVIGFNPLMSIHLNPISLLANGVIIYFIMLVCVKAFQKFKIQADITI